MNKSLGHPSNDVWAATYSLFDVDLLHAEHSLLGAGTGRCLYTYLVIHKPTFYSKLENKKTFLPTGKKVLSTL